VGAALVYIDNLKVPVVVVDNGVDVNPSVLFELLLISGTVDCVLRLSVFDIVLLVVIGQRDSRDFQVATLLYYLAPFFQRERRPFYQSLRL
jgi:hypothetical protein